MSKIIYVDFYPNGFGDNIPLHASYSHAELLKHSNHIEQFISILEYEFVVHQVRERDREIMNQDLVIEKLEQENKILKEALEFYANTLSYEHISGDNKFAWFRRAILAEDCCQVGNDEWCSYGGKKAREALEDIKENRK